MCSETEEEVQSMNVVLIPTYGGSNSGTPQLSSDRYPAAPPSSFRRSVGCVERCGGAFDERPCYQEGVLKRSTSV